MLADWPELARARPAASTPLTLSDAELLAMAVMSALLAMLAMDTSLWSDDVWVVDSTPVECGRSRETATRSDAAGWAEYEARLPYQASGRRPGSGI